MKGRLRIDFESLLPLITLVILGIFINQAHCAPAIDDEDAEGGCYYMFNHYGEGDRILTNEPCLNCTCHNSMLMCYLRVCPFTKPIGQDCTIEKKPDQCCPVISCPEEDVRIHTDQKKLLVPVSLVTPSAPSSTTPATTSLAPISDSTELAPYERGCEMNGKYYADGAQVEGDPSKPCELCYCIRNRTACVMQECILHVEGCEPVFQSGVCCPVRYRCDYPPQITDESSSTIASVITTTIQSIFQTTPQPGGCFINGDYYADGSRIPGAERSPCEHCYCMRGEPVCAVQECGAPLENEAGNCTAVPPPPGHCCPEKFTCGDSEEISADEPLSTPMAIVGETSPAPEAVSSDVATDSSAPQSDDQTELEPVRDATTVLPIEPVEVVTDEEVPIQADQPEEVASQTVPPTEASVADDKIDSGPSTTSPVSEGDAPAASGVNQEDEDIVQTPTEASVPPTIFPAESQPISQDQPEIPTEPTIVPGATDGPIASQDDSISSTSESVQVSSSTNEPSGETIFGTTIKPEPIPSENLQRPSSESPAELPSQDEQVSTTPGASSVAPSESTVRPEDIPTSASPVMPDLPEIIDIGSSEELMKPSDSPVVTTERPVNDAQSGSTTESIPADVSPVEIVTTERAQVQQDEEVIGTTSSPSSSAPSATESPETPENAPLGDDNNASEDTATTIAPSQSVSQDEAAAPTTSERPSEDESDSGSVGVTTQSPVSDGGDDVPSIVSDDQSSSSESGSLPATSQRPTETESQDTTQGPSVSDDDASAPTTQAAQQDAVTELPSSSTSSIDDDSNAQQDEAVTTSRPEPSVTDAPASQIVSDEGSQDSSTDSGISVTTSVPPSGQQQDEASTVLSVSSEKPLETESAAADQPTTVRPDVLPEEQPEDNEIVSDQGGESSSAPVTSEQPMAESSTENVFVTQPASAQQDEAATSQQPAIPEGTTSSSAGQLNDEASVQSTPTPGSQDDDVSSVGVSTQAPVESQTEASQQDASSQEAGQNETTVPPAPESVTSPPESSVAPSQDEQTDSPTRDATAAPEVTTSSPVSDQEEPAEPSQDQPENIDQGGPVTTVAPELSPERISTVQPPSNDETDVVQSTPTAIQAEQDAGLQQADQAQTTVPSIIAVSDDQSTQGQTTQTPIQEDSESIGQDEPVQTTPSSISVIAADESLQPTTGPSDLESSTDTPVIQDQPDVASPAQPPLEPEVTTVSQPRPTESDSQQSGSTEASSNEAMGDDAVTEGPATALPPVAGDIAQGDDTDAPAATTQAQDSSVSSSTESSDISSDEPATTSQPLPSADESVSSSTDTGSPIVESSTSAPAAANEAGEVIGVESVSNSPDGSESLSMMKTSTAAPIDGEVSSSSAAPVDVAAPEDNEISSDGTSQEGEQSSSAPSVSSEPSSEISASTSAPSADSDESSSSAPVSDVSSDDADATTPEAALPIREASTEASAISQTPDLNQPAEEINEIIPGTQQDTPDKISEQPEQVSGTTVSPDSAGAQKDEVPTTAPSASVPSSDDTSNDSVTTPASQETQSGDSASIEATSAPVADEPSVTTSAPGAAQDESVTTQRPISVDDESPVTPVQSDDSSSTQEPQTESSVQDQGSSSSDSVEQESVPITTSRPIGVDSDDAQEPTTEPYPVPAQPEEGVSDGVQDQESGIAQVQTTQSPSDVSGIKDQVAQVDEPSQGTTAQPEVGAVGVTSTIRPQQVSDDQATELPAGGSDEPAISDQSSATTAAPPSSQQDESPATEAPVSDDSLVPTTVTSISAADADAVSDAKPSEVDKQVGVTTQEPPLEDDQVAVTTSRPILIVDGSTESPISDEPSVTSLPDSSSSSDEPAVGTTSSPISDEPSVTSLPESSPSSDEAAAVTTSSPISDEPSVTSLPESSPSADKAVSGTTSSPISDEPSATSLPSADEAASGTTVLPISDEPSATSQPDSSPSADETVAATTSSPSAQPSGQDQSSDDSSVAATTVPPQSISQSTPDAISAETEMPEDSDEIRHPDDNTGDDGEVEGGVTTAQPEISSPVADETQTDGPPAQQDEGITTQAPLQDEPIVPGQEQATTLRPESEIPTTSASNVQGGSDAQADAVVTTERPSDITELPISMQPEAALGMMSSTEKVEIDSGSSTTESDAEEDIDSSTDSSVPGEGSCFVEGKTYRNGSSIPPTTPCHIACACKNSIVHCLLVHCPPPPARYVDCKPIYRSGVCCPDYDCGSTDEVSPVTITPEPPFPDNKDDTVFTVTPQGTSTPSSESLVSQQQDNSERPTTESELGSQDQPSEDGEGSSPSSDGAGIATTSSPLPPSDQAAFPTTVIPPAEPISSTDAPSQQAQQDSQQDSTEPPAVATTTTASTTTSERPSDIEQIIDSSSNAPPEMAESGSDVAPEEDDQSSSTTGPPAGSQYPVTTTTTVTPSTAPWPYPTSSTPPPGAMSSGACLFDGRVYMSAQQIPREDPCDFCFCFRGDIICLQQSCPPPIPGCYEEPIPGFCCPRYECPVGNGNHTTPPPLFPPSYYHNQILNNAAGGSGQSGGSMMGSVPSGPGCEIQGEYFETGQVITSTSGPCLECRCGSTGMMECDPRECQPEPMLRKMIAAITSRRR